MIKENLFTAIDVEIASKSPLNICAIAAVRIENGHEVGSYYSLVACPGRIGFTRIHKISSAALLDAPNWPTVWSSIINFIDDNVPLVAFRASFDRAAILAMCAQYGLRVPRLKFYCAASIAEKYLQRRVTLQEALNLLGMEFPGRPHDALADARAAAAVVLACIDSRGKTIHR